MTKIRIAFYGDVSKVIEINKPFEYIVLEDIIEQIDISQMINGWCKDE